MNIYLRIFTTTVKEYAAYRLNFVLWRFRMVLNLLFSFFLWSAVFDKRTAFGAYGKEAMISYILYVSMISTFVMGSRTAEIGYEIQNGSIINMLLRPVSFFRYYLVRDLADKTMNVVFAIVELLFVIWVFHASVIAPRNILLFLFFFINGVLISFFINLMLSFVGFFTHEIWAPRFLFTMLVFFVSGSYFPLNILPAPLYRALLFTPFPYLFYLPSQVIIGNLDTGSLLFEAVASTLWVMILYQCMIFVWRSGNKNFSFWGR